VSYPYREETAQATLTRLPATRYAEDDLPHLSTARYSISPDYDPRDVEEKKELDSTGAEDNLYWYTKGKGF
jgi:hypothetical protein